MTEDAVAPVPHRERGPLSWMFWIRVGAWRLCGKCHRGSAPATGHRMRNRTVRSDDVPMISRLAIAVPLRYC